jgi:hypothetical protein
MSKVITSPVKRWPGTVTLSDPLTFPQVIAFQDAIDVADELGSSATVSKYNQALLPGVLECVEAWELENFPSPVGMDNFPATPRKASSDLIGWLVTELVKLFTDSEPDPNE